MNELQLLVDALAGELGRPVGIDDRHFHALAYSSHDVEVDRVRRDSILRREAPQAVTEWLRSLSIEATGDHVRVPANPELGMDARVCVPVRFDGLLLAYLWLIDEPEPLDADALELSRRYADELATELVTIRRLESEGREREMQLLRQLLLGSDDGAAAAEELADGLLATARGYAVLVAQVAGARRREGEEPPGADPAAVAHLASAADQVRRRVPPHHLVSLTHRNEAIVVLAFDEPDERGRRADAWLTAADEHVPGGKVIVGVGAPRPAVADLRASYAEARLAVWIAHEVTDLGVDGPVRWETLGAYRTIALLLGERDPRSLLLPALERLLAERDGPMLVATAETYLELGCDARAASERLFLHRSSLYKRLHRIERLTGHDLRRGDDRLELHLGLRLWRLAGGAPPGRQSSPPAG